MGRSLAEQLAKLNVAKTKPPRKTLPKPAPAPGKTDEEVFLEEMSGTSPLRDRGRRMSPVVASERARARVSDDAEVLAQLADLVAGEGRFDIADSDEYVEGLAAGVDRRLLRRLRQGEYAVQAHVDLHGLTQAAARERVARFVGESQRAGRRCVLLVHGRGLHSKDNIPILKQAVRSWLERGQIARAVLAFASARPCDGGVGAVYVLLRR